MQELENDLALQTVKHRYDNHAQVDVSHRTVLYFSSDDLRAIADELDEIAEEGDTVDEKEFTTRHINPDASVEIEIAFYRTPNSAQCDADRFDAEFVEADQLTDIYEDSSHNTAPAVAAETGTEAAERIADEKISHTESVDAGSWREVVGS